MNESVLMLTIFAAIGLGTPIVFATVGEILAERSGILNLGVQGMMLIGAVAGFWATFQTGSLLLGVILAMFAGAALSVIHAFNSVTLRVSQIVSGLALTIFGTGVAIFIGRVGEVPLIGEPSRAVFTPVLPDALADLPIVGPLIFGHDALVYLSWVVVAASSFYLFRTRPGLTVRAVGEDPASAEAAGINVSRIRYIHVMIGGALAGLGGAYFSLALVPSWQDNPMGAAGWIAIALVILASWRPWRALWVAYLFGAAGRVSFTFQTLGIAIPASLLAMLPFVLAILAMLVLTSGKRARFLGAPAALGIPYFREER
ncbi:MAG: ABC transporter permease [Actinobacteria bacterium]|nr:MAG: ABC transporter permease [Actinomycetota bacterium]